MGEVKWVKFDARHGGGHMGSTTEYKPYLYGIEEEHLDAELESWCQQFRNVKATAEIVDRLPDKVVHWKLREHACSIEFHNHILISLIGDPT